MSTIAFDLQQLYYRQFGSKPVIPKEQAVPQELPPIIGGTNPGELSNKGSSLTEQYRGMEIWLPVKFCQLDVTKFGASEVLMPYSTVKVSGKKYMVETPMVERQGTVKELYSIEDYNITLKGFLIGYDSSGKYPEWPEAELELLNKLWLLNEAIQLDNALTNEFIQNGQKVVIKDFDLPEVTGGKKHIRPFSMTLATDSIFTLEL